MFDGAREIAKIGVRRDLKGEPRQAHALAVFQHDRFQASVRRNHRTLSGSFNHTKAKHARVVVNLSFNIRGRKSRVRKTLNLYHGITARKVGNGVGVADYS